MNIRKYRWSKHYESAEEELIELLAAKNIDATRWTLEAGATVPLHPQAQDGTIWCADGTVIYKIAGKQYSLQPGDSLDIPADALVEATAGLFGCVCYERHA
jgi:quercetin dioxygenase-like cupin family protein